MSTAPYGWQYEWVVIASNENLDNLNSWGAAGWEAVSVVDKPEWGTMMVLLKAARPAPS